MNEPTRMIYEFLAGEDWHKRRITDDIPRAQNPADYIKEYVELMVLGNTPPPTLGTALLTFALADVDWFSIANAFENAEDE